MQADVAPERVLDPDWIRDALLTTGTTQKELAEEVGVSEKTINRWVNGHTPWRLSDEKAMRAFFSARGWKERPTIRVLDPDDERAAREAYKSLLPIYSVSAVCGAMREGSGDVEPEGWVEAGKLVRKNRFVVRARGDSMVPVIHNGDLVVIERREAPGLPENNPTVLVEYDDGAKRAHAIKILSVVPMPHATPQNPRRLVTLLSANENHPPISVRDAGVTVVGTFVGVILPPE